MSDVGIDHMKGKVRSAVPSSAFLQILIASNLDIDRPMISLLCVHIEVCNILGVLDAWVLQDFYVCFNAQCAGR